jgi:hypothetical protein
MLVQADAIITAYASAQRGQIILEKILKILENMVACSEKFTHSLAAIIEIEIV